MGQKHRNLSQLMEPQFIETYVKPLQVFLTNKIYWRDTVSVVPTDTPVRPPEVEALFLFLVVVLKRIYVV